ncbi:hypothetical protein G6F43_012352 [Rhizopus delemar]|nr:hypothetical protein G6F43_012352 [Rhizopus delemar]
MGIGNQQLLVAQHSSTRFPHTLHTTSPSLTSSASYITSRFRTKPTNREFNSRLTTTKDHSGSNEFFTRFLQLHLCDSEEKQRYEAGFQLQGAQSVHSSTSFQNGNSVRGFSFDIAKRLPYLNRSSFGIHSYPNPSSIAEVPTVFLERKNLRVSDSTFRAQHSTLPVHQADSSYFAMGTQTRNPATHSAPSQQTSITGMDDQPRQICTSTDSTTGTFGIHFGHHHNGVSGTEVQDQKPEEVITISFETTSINTTSDSQSDDAHTSSDFCASASPDVHPPSTSTQKSDGSPL